MFCNYLTIFSHVACPLPPSSHTQLMELISLFWFSFYFQLKSRGRLTSGRGIGWGFGFLEGGVQLQAFSVHRNLFGVCIHNGVWRLQSLFLATSVFRATFAGVSYPSFCGIQQFNSLRFFTIYQNCINSSNRTHVESPAFERQMLAVACYISRISSRESGHMGSEVSWLLYSFFHYTFVCLFSECSKPWHIFIFTSITYGTQMYEK